MYGASIRRAVQSVAVQPVCRSGGTLYSADLEGSLYRFRGTPDHCSGGTSSVTWSQPRDVVFADRDTREDHRASADESPVLEDDFVERVVLELHARVGEVVGYADDRGVGPDLNGLPSVGLNVDVGVMSVGPSWSPS